MPRKGSGPEYVKYTATIVLDHDKASQLFRSSSFDLRNALCADFDKLRLPHPSVHNMDKPDIARDSISLRWYTENKSTTLSSMVNNAFDTRYATRSEKQLRESLGIVAMYHHSSNVSEADLPSKDQHRMLKKQQEGASERSSSESIYKKKKTKTYNAKILTTKALTPATTENPWPRPAPLDRETYKASQMADTQGLDIPSNDASDDVDLLATHRKIDALHRTLMRSKPYGTIDIDVRRDSILQDTHAIFAHLSDKDTRKRLNVSFNGRTSFQAFRDWITKLAEYVAQPNTGPFAPASPGNATMEISACFAPWEAEEPPMSHFEYMGRCVALVILHKRVYDAHMSPAFFKTLLGRRVTLCDLRPVDADLYRSLCWMLENDITGVLDETFTVTEPVRGGGVRTVELCAGGEHIKVTQSNKRSYVDARVRYRLYGRVQRQTEAFRKGLNGIVPIGLLQDFTEQELSVLFCAAPNVDMKIWMTRTRYTGYTSTDLVIMWFWKCVNEWTDAQRAKLLLFVTGTPRVSVGEFQDELSRRGPNDFIIERAGNPWDLPTSHACASTLHLPPYPHYETLKKKLLYAVEESQEVLEEEKRPLAPPTGERTARRKTRWDQSRSVEPVKVKSEVTVQVIEGAGQGRDTTQVDDIEMATGPAAAALDEPVNQAPTRAAASSQSHGAEHANSPKSERLIAVEPDDGRKRSRFNSVEEPDTVIPRKRARIGSLPPLDVHDIVQVLEEELSEKRACLEVLRQQEKVLAARMRLSAYFPAGQSPPAPADSNLPDTATPLPEEDVTDISAHTMLHRLSRILHEKQRELAAERSERAAAQVTLDDVQREIAHPHVTYMLLEVLEQME